mgnify:CR=1 FL=1
MAPLTQTRNPIPDADDEGRKVFMALLERRALFLSHENLRLRACLERATGTQWDSTDFADLTAEQMDEIVANEMSVGLRLSIEDARELVRQNKAMANPSQNETAAPA